MNNKERVWASVEKFRAQYLPGNSYLPIDVFTIAEIDLKLDMIPFKGLTNKYRVDAALTHDFTGIFVDEESYSLLEKGPIWKQKRLRFSVAHELGHFFMHREIAQKEKFYSLEDFCKWIRKERYDLEQEANEFAGRLLVPVERLQKDCQKFISFLENPNLIMRPPIRDGFAERVSDAYGVTSQVIQVRLDREGIWLVE